jgi:aspartate racemase
VNAHDLEPATKGTHSLAPLRVGILGGMGPAATADFYAKLVAATPATTDQEHLPVVIWADPRIPDRTAAVLGEGPDPSPCLAEGVGRLICASADLIAIPCNTAHAFLDAVRSAAASVPVLDMVTETAAELSELLPHARVGVLATSGTLAAGLYQEALRRYALEPVIPDDTGQDAVMSAIRHVKAGGEPDTARAWISLAVEALARAGADIAVAACTEIPLLLTEGKSRALPLVDATDVLARSVVRRAYPVTSAGRCVQGPASP